MVDQGVDHVHALCFVGGRRMSARRRTAAAPTHARIVIWKTRACDRLTIYKNSVLASAPPYFFFLGVFCSWDIKILPDTSEQTK